MSNSPRPLINLHPKLQNLPRLPSGRSLLAAILLWMLLTAPMLLLTGCSNGRLESEPMEMQVVASLPPIQHPPLPQPLFLEPVAYSACGDKFCLSVAEAKKDLRNRIKIGGWMTEAGSALRYYRSLGIEPTL